MRFGSRKSTNFGKGLKLSQTLTGKSWFIILMLIVFFPVGIYFMWRKSSWSMANKIVVTAIFAGLCIMAGMQPTIKSLELSPNSIPILDIDESKTISGSATPEGIRTSNVEFVSENDNIATFKKDVNSDELKGIVTAVGEGKTFIYIKTRSVSSNKIEITVQDMARNEAEKKAEEEEAARKAAEAEAQKKAEEEEAARKAAEAEAQKKAEEEEAARKVAEAEAQKKAEEEEAARKVAEAEAQKKAEEEEAARKATEAEAQKKTDTTAVVSSEQSQSPKLSKNSKTVYVTPTGKKYHYDSHCNGGHYTESTLDEAKARGLTPCKKCVK